MLFKQLLLSALVLMMVVPKVYGQKSPQEKYQMEERHRKIIEALKNEATPEKIRSNLFKPDEVLSGVYTQEMLDAYEDFFYEYPNLATPNSKNGFFKTFHAAKDFKVLIRTAGIKEYYLGHESQQKEIERIQTAIEDESLDSSEKMLMAHWLYRSIEKPYKAKLRQAFEEHYEEEAGYFKKGFEPLAKEELRDLFYHLPDWSTFAGGNYQNSIKLFVFCRRDRNFPCFIVGKDQFDLPIMDENGLLWGQPALAASSRGLPSSVRNGQTPTGVQTIDSVMPMANRPADFGQFRRLILNWTTKDDAESMARELLATSAQDKAWWREALISRDVGRTDLRIHGTGKINPEPDSTFYPFRKSSGCITQREGVYPEQEYKDQRRLLDSLMKALDLEPLFENESKIKGVLYLIEMDDQKKPVTREELISLLLD